MTTPVPFAKHYETRLRILQEVIESGEVGFEYVEASRILADCMTKPLILKPLIISWGGFCKMQKAKRGKGKKKGGQKGGAFLFSGFSCTYLILFFCFKRKEKEKRLGAR